MNLLLTVVLAIAVVRSGVRGLINGRTAHIDEFPFLAIVCEYDWPIAMGVILDSKHILLAASHLVESRPASLSVMIGTTEFTHCNGLGIPVHSYRVHTNCDNDIHDIAVIKLASRMIYGATVQDIGIGLPSNARCSFCVMTGYKRFDEADDEDIIVFDDNSIVGWSPAVMLDRRTCTDRGMDLGETEVCLKDPDHQTKVTLADHGFPIICDGYVVGLILTMDDGHVPAHAFDPAVMVNLSYYADWIYGS